MTTTLESPTTNMSAGQSAPRTAERERTRRAKKNRDRNLSVTLGLVLTFVVVMSLSPFVWAFLTAVKPFQAAFTNPPTWVFEPQFDAFVELWRGTQFASVLGNTFLVAVLTVIVALCVGAPAAYAFARYAGVIGPILLILAVVLRTIPRFAIVLPFYEASQMLGIYDTNFALVAALVAVNMPFTLLLLIGFFRDIPKELDEAAMIDGCSHFGAFRRVIIPLMGPGLVTAGVFTLLVAFQEYLVALTLTQNSAVTIPVFIAAQKGADDVSTYQTLAAASILLVIPVVFIAIFARKYLVAGLGGGAVKG
ncbi:carbohydrate ABC transporter permease [Cryobacterium melibiosiphilum]|uniref:Carbohydrate ABC transporter permease n=1 Tax=Cryobacterium melibiosiphilum TaxID=995039 RepID=A0A3A5MJX3_9MICO|nr:carbohydrate ABC transporter permease [Cryobacterium melibiosiphilum]RJT90460.1 carbohydrate ABC transporter permease [Cryobacterium melibiosiphilum]